jgi:membrane-associated PAP2 superfamily phosphatase
MTGSTLPPALRQRDLAWCLGLLGLLLLWDLGGLDLWLMREMASPAGFAWRDHWFTTRILHEGGRGIGWLIMGLLVVQLWWPLPFSRGLTIAERRWWLATCLLCLAVIPILKNASLTSCPWSLAEFGGQARYVSHWQLGVSDGGGGHCFPSGHASAAFAFLAGYFALRERHPVAARRWLLGILGLGFVLGLGQTLRGAHYPSHTLWTGWICLALTIASRHSWQWLHRNRRGGPRHP